MARMTGFIFQDRYYDQTKNLSDQELGRLVRACSIYHMTGEVQDLKGRESMAFDFIRYEIDENEKGYQAKCETNKKNRKGTTDDGERQLTNDNDRNQSSTTVNDRQRPSTTDNESAKININIKEKKDICSSSCGNDARAREDTGAFTGFGSAYSEDELAAMQKQRMEDIPAIERLMRECGYAFSPADETIAIELLNSGETTDGILEAIRIAKEGNALNWRYIKGILKKQKEGSYGTGTGNRRTGTASAGTGSAGARGRSSGKAADDSEDDFDRYLKSCVV